MSHRESVVDRLRTYYLAHGISALDFCCKHRTECSANSPSFTAAQETYVGPEYVAGALPRLLFLSLDSGSLHADPSRRTMEAVQRRVLADDVHRLPKGKHWYETHDLALTLFRRFDPSIRMELVSRHFAHANAAKCCQNKPERSKADGVLFDNCREYIGEEIRILRPDILVTQGREARLAIEHHFLRREHVQVTVDGESCEYSIIDLSTTHQAIWFATHHPRYYGGFWIQKRTCWPKYADAAVAFVNGRPVMWVDAARDEDAVSKPIVPATPDTHTPHGKPIDARGRSFVWVNTSSGWVVHGSPRRSAARAAEVAALLTRRLGWMTAAGEDRPSPRPAPPGAPSAAVAAVSPAF